MKSERICKQKGGKKGTDVGQLVPLSPFGHRVVDSKGNLAGAFAFGVPNVQVELLRNEGVEVVDNRVELSRFQLRE